MFPDSSSHHHDATHSIGLAPGIAGNGATFNGAGSVDFGDPLDGSLDASTASFSVSLWIRVTQSAGAFDMPLAKGAMEGAIAGYNMQLGTGAWSAFVSDGSSNPSATFTNEVLGAWTHLALVVDRPAHTLRAITNGVMQGSADIATLGSLASTRHLTFGDSTYVFKGVLDEVRIYSSAKTAAWFRAEYLLLTDPSLISVSPEELL